MGVAESQVGVASNGVAGLAGPAAAQTVGGGLRIPAARKLGPGEAGGWGGTESVVGPGAPVSPMQSPVSPQYFPYMIRPRLGGAARLEPERIIKRDRRRGTRGPGAGK